MDKQELEELKELLDIGNEKEETDKGGGFNIMALISTLWAKRKHFYISIPIAAVVAILLSLCIPKTYSVDVVLAPELSNMASQSGGLGSIMKNLGLGSMSKQGTDGDAILPNLYPDLMNSQAFLVSLFDIPVVSKDGKIRTTYYDYLDKHQEHAPWTLALGYLISLLPQDDEEDFVSTPATSTSHRNSTAQHQKPKVNAYALNKRQTNIVKAIAKNVVCDVDKKTYVISISVKAQDPVICATVADSACRRLQEFITDYRTKKARIDYEHIKEQYDIAKAEYEESKAKVAAYNDANWDLVEEDFVVEKQAQQNEMQLRFSALSAINTQLLAARSKVDEARPVFTILDGPSIPLKPTGPKKKSIVIGIIFLVCMVQACIILKREHFGKKKEEEEQTAEVK